MVERSYPASGPALSDRERAIQAIRRGVPIGLVVKCSCNTTPPTRNGCFGVCEDSVAAIIASYEALRRTFTDAQTAPVQASQFWEALKRQCAASPDKSKVKALVQVRCEDVVAAWNALAVSSTGCATPSEPADGHGYSGPFSATEFNERAWDHEKAAKNGLSAGPNISYVRTFQACAVALRYAAKHMEFEADASSVPSTERGSR